jgi:hypothetical protein
MDIEMERNIVREKNKIKMVSFREVQIKTKIYLEKWR